MYSLQGHLALLECNSRPRISMLIGGIWWYPVAFGGIWWHSLFKAYLSGPVLTSHSKAQKLVEASWYIVTLLEILCGEETVLLLEHNSLSLYSTCTLNS